MVRSAKSRSSLYVGAPVLLPPKLTEFGHRPFASREQEALAQWLREPTWPRDTLNIYALEGYLTALLVWPVALQPGAWLPPIWNEEGWRVRPPIDSRRQYEEFLELTVGFLRAIDRGLLMSPAVFEPSLRMKSGHDSLDAKTRAQHWAQGFGRGLRQGVQSRDAPSADARNAVRAIAVYAAGQSFSAMSGPRPAGAVLAQSVLALANTRTSRGPLGALTRRVPIVERSGLQA